MPYDDPAETDPLSLNGIAFEATPETATDAAYNYAEEFARIGQSKEAILLMFQMQHYQGPYEALKILGLETITEIVNECCGAMEACRAALRSDNAR